YPLRPWPPTLTPPVAQRRNPLAGGDSGGSTPTQRPSNRLDPRPRRRRERLEDFAPGWEGAARRVVAELVGTFALTTVDAGGAMIATLNPQVTSSARAAAAGLLIMAMSYALSNVSGAHFNPTVTLAFALRRVFPWKYVPAYWFAQLGGAMLGAGFLCLLLGPIGHLGATLPEHGDAKAFAMEAFLTFLLVSVILSVATRHKVVGPTAALASGGTVALCGLFARPISGASMNPARSLGPFIVGWSFAHAWV